MDFLISRYRNLTVLLVVIISQLLLLAYQVKNNQDVRVLRVWFVSVVTPLARVLEFARANTIGIAEDYFVLVHVRDENVRLSKENGELKLENQYLRNELSTADRVKALRAFQEETPSRTLAARVIGNGTGANSQVVFIDRGSGSGIVRGMPVVTPDGIVGKVLASYPTASQVLLITDPNFAAGVESQKNHVHGTLVGLGQSKCMVKYVQNEEKVDQGEMFYTSGDDRIFPKGMPVGHATVVRQGRDFKEIYVQPSGWTNALEEVLVVSEGVHQPIPEVTTIPANAPMYVGAPPPEDKNAKPVDTNSITTEADKLRDRYKRIGDAQNHTFGVGTPGSKPPDFNLDPDGAAKRAAAAAKAAQGGPSGASGPKPAGASGAIAGATGARPPVPGATTAQAPRPVGQQPAGATGVRTATPQNHLPQAPAVTAGRAVDANGNPIVARPKPRLDANGNPLPAAPRPQYPAGEIVDAQGHPIGRTQPAVDANGNPIVRKPAPVQRDANGNPIAARPVQRDANGNPIVRKPAAVQRDANGNPIVAKPRTSTEGATKGTAAPIRREGPPARPSGASGTAGPRATVRTDANGDRIQSDKTTINVITPAKKPKTAPKPAATEAQPQ